MSNSFLHRPFNLEHAKEGAPVAMSDGRSVRLLCFDRANTHGYSIVGLIDTGEGREATFSCNSNGDPFATKDRQKLVMIPLGFIEDKPVYTGDIYTCHGLSYKALTHQRDFTGFSWPAKKVIKEVWQGKFRGYNDVPYIKEQSLYSSAQACLDGCRYYSNFVEPVLVGTYETKE